MMRRVICLLLTGLCLGSLVTARPVLGEPVEIVISKQAEPLERFAASELERSLERLFVVSVNVVTSPGETASPLFLLGATAHHPGRELGIEGFPQLTDQGFLLRRTTCRNRPSLVIAGGSPEATMWAVYELIERYGVRYLLGGDVYPETRRPFFLPDVDRVFEPAFRARWFKTMGDFAMGTEGWGIADYRPLIDQLAKLKFNRIRVGSSPSQPFLDLKIAGLRQQFATLWYGYRYPITADMPGRRLFGNQREFWNPDLPLPEAGYEKLAAAGQRHCHALIAYAHRRGMQASFVASVTDFPKEFRPIIPGAQVIHQLGELTVGPGAGVRPDDPRLEDIAGTVIRTIIDTYPEADSYGFPAGTEWRSWVDLYAWAWRELDKRYGIHEVLSLDEALRRTSRRVNYSGGAQRAAAEVKGDITGLYFLDRLWTSPAVLPKSRKPDARLVVYEVAEELFPILPRVLPKGAELAVVLDYTSTRVLRRRAALREVPAKAVPTTLVLTLQDDNIGVLPQIATGSLHELVGEMRSIGISGFSTREWMISDLDPTVAYLSKAAWDSGATPRAVSADQVRAVCGEAAVGPMLEALGELEAVTAALEDHGLGLCFPVPGMMMKHWAPGPFSKEFSEDRDRYRRALSAVGKAPEPRRAEGKAYLRYWIGRLEFAVGYFDAIEAVQQAAAAEKAARDAKQKGDWRAFRARLGEAAERTKAAQDVACRAIEAFAGVARNQADRGAIATMAEYVYRPLKRKAEELRAAQARGEK